MVVERHWFSLKEENNSVGTDMQYAGYVAKEPAGPGKCARMVWFVAHMCVLQMHGL